MNILVSNDDGVNAQGILELVEALSHQADIYVCAPDSQRSASGHAITVSRPIWLSETDFPGAKRALICSGTPADCVKLGLAAFREQGITMDIVFSGINHGANLGTDVLYSGTVSAAIEGVISGLPAVAVSVNSHEPSHFSGAKRIAVETLKKAAAQLDQKTVLNINVPDLPDEEIRGVRITALGAREYENEFHRKEEKDGKLHYQYGGTPVFYENLPQWIDVAADQDQYISITPLQYDLTNYTLLEEVKNFKIEWK